MEKLFNSDQLVGLMASLSEAKPKVDCCCLLFHDYLRKRIWLFVKVDSSSSSSNAIRCTSCKNTRISNRHYAKLIYRFIK